MEASLLFPVWPSSLPENLASIPIDNCPSPYSTEAVLSGEAASAKSSDDVEWYEKLELPGPATRQFLNNVGLSATSDVHLGILNEANSLISVCECIAKSVQALVRSFGLIYNPKPEYDYSHSDPDLPYSIFFSIPPGDTSYAGLRVADSIIHETMHLQLSLFERIEPIISRNGETIEHYSPWRNENRPARGVFHGIYVFFILRYWYTLLLDCKYLAESPDFINKRITTINYELDSIREFTESKALTSSGQQIAAKIFDEMRVLG